MLHDYVTFLSEKRPFIEKHDLISLLSLISQFPADSSYCDINLISKVISQILCQLYGEHFFNELYKIFVSIDENGFIVIDGYKLYIKDRFAFQVYLIVSLKYTKMSYLYEHGVELETFIEKCLKYVCLDKTTSLHVLKVIETILKKRPQSISQDLSLTILKKINEAAISPLVSFKHQAQTINKTLFRWLSRDIKEQICNLNNCSLKSIDVNDIIKYHTNNELQNDLYFKKLNMHVIKLFQNNTDSRNGSFYYDALAHCCSFDEFKSRIWPIYEKQLHNISLCSNNDGEFVQSLIKYWIPINVKYYKEQFYIFIKNTDLDVQLKSYILLEMKKKGFHNSNFNFYPAIIDYIKLQCTVINGVKTLCSFHKKSIQPLKNDIDALILFITLNSGQDDIFTQEIFKALSGFMSQIFIATHVYFKSVNLELYTDLLRFIYEFVLRNIDNSEFCEVAAQFLLIIWKISESSSSLTISYNLNRDSIYNNGENLFYKYLIECGFWKSTFLSTDLVDKISEFATQTCILCPYLIEAAIEYYIDYINTPDILFGETFKSLDNSVYLNSSEIIRIRAKFALSIKIFRGVDYSAEIQELLALFYKNLSAGNLFFCVLVLDVLIVMKKYNNQLDLAVIIEKSLDYISDIFKEDNPVLDIKSSKVLEAFINNTIESISSSQENWSQFDKYRLLEKLTIIIQRSNMKKPVSVTVRLVQNLGKLMEASDSDKILKAKFLDATLRSLYAAPEKLNIKMRRNPETRLVIHALCISSEARQRMYLEWSLNVLLKILSDPESSDSSLASTLNCLEVLMSDNNLHYPTLRYVPDLILYCVRIFNKSSWPVRNADLQLCKALIERFLGVSLGPYNRPKSVEEIFILFPQLIQEFHKILEAPNMSDSTIIALLFFAESQIKSTIFISDDLKNAFNKFKLILSRMINTSCYIYGILAVKSFSALLNNDEIPVAFCNIVAHIKNSFRHMKMNILRNFMNLLKCLYHKYSELFANDSCNIKTLQFHYHDLICSLKIRNNFAFNLYYLKILPLNSLLEELNMKNIDFRKRIWLNNYLPFIIREASDNVCVEILEKMIGGDVPDFLQAHVLSIFIEKIINDDFNIDKILIQRIMTILVHLLIQVPCRNLYLTTLYSKTILLIYQKSQFTFISSLELVNIVKRNFNEDACLYKIIIYALVLSHCVNYNSEIDEIFLSKSVISECFLDDDDDILLDISCCFIFLYKITRVNERFEILKLAFFLLLNKSCALEMCKFVSFLSGEFHSTLFAAIRRFLSIPLLLQCLHDKKLVIRLLIDFCSYIDYLLRLTRCDNNPDTFYITEYDFSLSLQHVKRLVLSALCNI